MNRRLQLPANYSGWVAGIANVARRLVREVVAELVRLNRTGLAADTPVGKSRSDLGRIVAAALAHRNDDINRCC